MSTMRVMEIKERGAPLALSTRPAPQPGDRELLLKVECCGICHGDALVMEGHFPGLRYPRIPGHEVVGIIERLGSGVHGFQVGQRVGVGWHGGHCGECDACRVGEFGSCERGHTTGLTMDGGYAEYMIARPEATVHIPEELSSVEAAPLLCAGRTTFGALSSSKARGGDLVAIHGLGGLGHLAVQYAVKLGLRVAVVSRGEAKRQQAMALGAHHYIDAKAEDPGKALHELGGARVILGTAPSGKELSRLVGGLGRGGELIVVTGAGDPLVIPPFLLLGGGKSIRGWVGGTLKETLDFSIHAKVVPMVEVFPLERAAEAFEKMMSAAVRFRAVLTMNHKEVCP